MFTLRGVGKGTAPPLPLWRSQQSAAGTRLGKEREGRGGSRAHHQHQLCCVCLLTRSQSTSTYSYSCSLCVLPTSAASVFGYQLKPSLTPSPSVPQQLRFPWRVVAACRT